MKVVIQRCKEASVTVNENIVGKITNGYTLFVGFSSNDKEDTLEKMANKIINLRIFEDENEKMNKDSEIAELGLLSFFMAQYKSDKKNEHSEFDIEWIKNNSIYHELQQVSVHNK